MIRSIFEKGHATLLSMTVVGACVLAVPSYGEKVTLKSSDGTVNLVGEFVEFSEDYYVIQTAVGFMRVSAARVRCEGDACPVFETADADVYIAGSGTVGQGLMPLLMSGFASHLDAEASISATAQEGQILADFVGDSGFGDEIGRYLVSSSTSNDAFTSLNEKQAQIGMTSRRILPAEARTLKKSGAGKMIDPKQENIVAVDAIVLITHPSNPVSSLTLLQVADIYSGKISNWTEVGGENAPIKVIGSPESSDLRVLFDNRVFGDEPNDHVGTEVVADDQNALAALVNDDPAAIGFVGYAFLRGAKPLDLINECGVPTRADAFSAKTEEYALQRRLYLYTRGDTDDENVDSFINYVTSEDADGVIAKSGFIDLGVSRRVQELDGERATTMINSSVDAYEFGLVQEMLSEMSQFDRLSTTFRFRTGSSKLDERGALDMERLTKFLESRPSGTRVKLVGFTDDVGAFDANRNLSVTRADDMTKQLNTFGGNRLAAMDISSAGYGEIAPTACNITEFGRSINRRVEVWIEAGK